MTQVIHAVFDGESFRPTKPITLAANTQVRMIIETIPAQPAQPRSFLQTARSSSIEGPADWSSRLDTYLYGCDISDSTC